MTSLAIIAEVARSAPMSEPGTAYLAIARPWGSIAACAMVKVVSI
ncbi:protein of unknown function [Shewanella benthica]|uniref:Uncharacterized protein n=1 Tax=Shewanella benthica TaxID=43661 RepID=A0A330M7B9_9GAMM|nr:protein of unknown function [Shewanella benthica]